MPDIGSNPFAEPDFSALQTSSGEEDEEFDDDVDDLEEDFDDEGEEVDGGEGLEVGEPTGKGPVADPEAEEPSAEDDAGNRVAGGTARSVLEHVARSIVDDPEGVAVDVSETRSGIHLSLHVSQSDMGRIIGRRGRTAQALRTLVRAAAARDSQEASVDIVD
jgi:predicted RNA-binding protein YlqC (UPF0109 family)